MNNSGHVTFKALFFGVLAAGMLFVSCNDSPVNITDEDELKASSLTPPGTGSEEVVNLVFKSDESVDSWDPILPATADPNWPSTICYQENAFGINASWSNKHKAYQFPRNTHPWESNTGYSWDANWINAWSNITSIGVGGHNWTKYETEVSGDGEFVVQLLADNCSWIYLDYEIIGFQGVGDESDPAKGKYGVNLDGDHILTFIIFDGGGAAGGKFRLETTESFGGVAPPPIQQNTAPEADAGADQVVEATGPNMTVNLDGSASIDADGDALSYAWTYGGSEISTAVTATADLPVGTHTFTLTVSDGEDTDADEVVVEVEDTIAPVLTYNQVTSNLWPPNHKMVLVLTGISASDLVNGATEVNVTVTSNEPANGWGDGNTEQDYEIVTHSDGTVDVYLRAERSGRGGGRTYTVAMSAADAAGNTAVASVTASVAKSQGRR